MLGLRPTFTASLFLAIGPLKANMKKFLHLIAVCYFCRCSYTFLSFSYLPTEHSTKLTNSRKRIANCRFCVGDRFYLCDNKILCEYDYEERMMFATMPSYNPPPMPTYMSTPSSAMMTSLVQGLPPHPPPVKRHMACVTGPTDDGSSGYGSPSPNSS